jgi:WD40 repeat protein
LDVASGEELRSLSLVPEGEVDSAPDWGLRNVAFAPGGRVLGAGRRGIRRFDLEAGSTEWLWRTDPRTTAVMAASGDRRRVVAAGMPDVSPQAPWAAPVLVDPETKAATPIRGYGDRVRALALDAAGAVLVTGDEEGLVRVGRLEGGEPHLLYGHSERVEFVALSPDGRWIASAAGGEIRLWPMPDLSQPPLHTLPLQALVAKLGGLTNLRLVEDAAAGTGIRLEAGPFPGWGNAPAR